MKKLALLLGLALPALAWGQTTVPNFNVITMVPPGGGGSGGSGTVTSITAGTGLTGGTITTTGTIALAVATSSTIGGVSPDNVSILNTAGAISVTPSSIGLGNVTNNAQTQAAVVPNTAPAAGNILVGNAGGTAYAKQAVSGDVSAMTSAGVTTVTGFNGVVSATASATYMPVIVYVKNMTLTTSGGATDIGTITMPSGITRYRLCGTGATPSPSTEIAETASGSLASASMTLYTGSGGTGTAISAAFLGPAAVYPGNSATGVVPILSASATLVVNSGTTIYVHETANSANAGTISIYLMIYPMM